MDTTDILLMESIVYIWINSILAYHHAIEKKFKAHAPQSIYIWLPLFKLIEFRLRPCRGQGNECVDKPFLSQVNKMYMQFNNQWYQNNIILVYKVSFKFLLGFISCFKIFFFQLLSSLISLTFLIIFHVFQSHWYHRDWFTTQ